MELRRYLSILRRRIWLIALCAVVGLGVAFATVPRGSQYEATTTIYVGNRQFGDRGSLSQDQTQGIETVARTFAVMIASPPIAREALQNTRVQRTERAVSGRTLAVVIPGTSLIRVTYKDPDPTAAQRIANALSDALVRKVQDYEPGVGSEGSVPVLPAYVFARADLPLKPESNGGTGHVLTGLLFGVVVAAALAFLLEYLDITPRSAEDLERHLGLPVLGVIPLLSDSVAERRLVSEPPVRLSDLEGDLDVGGTVEVMGGG
jgi:capsular polysaccharide biosynthesis protein